MCVGECKRRSSHRWNTNVDTPGLSGGCGFSTRARAVIYLCRDRPTVYGCEALLMYACHLLAPDGSNTDEHVRRVKLSVSVYLCVLGARLVFLAAGDIYPLCCCLCCAGRGFSVAT